MPETDLADLDWLKSWKKRYERALSERLREARETGKFQEDVERAVQLLKELTQHG
jgi:hypothetical protein